MTSTLSRPATLGALALCVLLSGILASRCIDGLSSSGPLSLESQSALQMLPAANAVVLGKIDVKELQQDAINMAGEFSLEEILNDVTNEASARLRVFTEQTGFDPMTDINSVYYAGSGQGHDADAAMVIYADMDSGEMTDFVEENLADELSESTHKGVTIFSVNADEGMSFAFVNDATIVVAPNERTIQSMIDRATGSGDADSEHLSDLVNLVSGSDAWMVVPSIQEHANANEMENADERLGLASRAIDQLAIGIDVSSDAINVQSYFGPTKDVSNDDLESIIKGAIAAVRTSADDEKPIIAEMLDRVSVSKRAGMVRVSITVDSEDLDQLRMMTDGSHRD